ncbi:MAG: AAC(3) family N-acetyltransferase [Chloroflexia bacterium]
MSESRRDAVGESKIVTEREIVEGLRALGFDGSRPVIVHSSLRSFGWVEGGAATVCRALLSACGTIVAPAFTDYVCRVPPRPASAAPTPCSLRMGGSSSTPRSPVPSHCSQRRVASSDASRDAPRGFRHATATLDVVHRAARADKSSALPLDHPLGPIEAVEQLDGDVLLLGVSLTRTPPHLASSGSVAGSIATQSGRRVWVELPNIPARATASMRSSRCSSPTRARSWDLQGAGGGCGVLAAAEEMILAPRRAALQRCRLRTVSPTRQRLAWLHAGGT